MSKQASTGAAEAPSWFRTFGLAVVVFVIVPVSVLVPVVFVPTEAARLDPLPAFYLPKFRLLAAFLAPLLAAALGAALLNRGRPRVPGLLPALAFLGVSALSTLFSGDAGRVLVGERFNGLISVAAGFLLFYVTARFMDSWGRVRAFLAAGVAAATLISVYGILQSFKLDSLPGLEIPRPMAGRVFSTLSGPGHLAAYLTLMVGATMALYLGAEKRWARMLCLVALALVGACWLYTYTRGAMLGAGVALPVVLWLAHRRLGSVRPLLLPLAVLAVAMLAAQLSNPQTSSLLSRFSDTSAVQAKQGEDPGSAGPTRDLLKDRPARERGEDSSLSARARILRDTVPVILERPLLGHGPDNFREPFADHMGEDLRPTLEGRQYVDAAHNELFQIAATTGILGLAAYAWLLVAYFRNAYRRGGWVLLALSGGVLAYVLQLQALFTTIAGGITFWAILGVSAAVMRLQDKASPGEVSEL